MCPSELVAEFLLRTDVEDPQKPVGVETNKQCERSVSFDRRHKRIFRTPRRVLRRGNAIGQTFKTAIGFGQPRGIFINY